jgi:ATP-dependent exoDNAse (exonuclease V) alpha subunit
MPTRPDHIQFAKHGATVELSGDQEGALAAIPDVATYGRCIFVTGRAGTGKSTVLRRFVETTPLKTVVLAPTGLAAVQVGGQTIHSFFNFPLGPLQVGTTEIPLFKKGQAKRRLIEALDCVVVDEVSMVRADVMDAIDHSLRINRDRAREPFGGATIVCFGDLMQLEPVVQSGADEEMMADRYQSPFFFDAKAVRETSLDVYELTTVHRQREDEEYLWALNRMREGNTDELGLFNARVGADIGSEGVVTLTATNGRAGSINLQRLAKLPGRPTIYKATIQGTFGRETPTDEVLAFKPGAQVMFVKNGREWVNGSLGEVTEVEPERVRVKLFEGEEHWVEPETWDKKRYTWDRFAARISSEAVGSFTQIPLRLAWALTIHKAQGLTLEKVRLDLDRPAFSHGQAYVALSRCRTLLGLSLVRPLEPRDVIVVERALAFATQARPALGTP